MRILINIMGWVASLLIVGSYYLNIKGKWKADTKSYVLCNLVGGLLFTVNTIYLGAYPSAMVNVVWVAIALAAVAKWKKQKPNDAAAD
ncbi:MAG: hypothetical protein EAY75_14810 [Bacteroidetes bacterium]|nr:MAG: hypothetical protein EAY75_14810 [Bacteroidota bacterium]